MQEFLYNKYANDRFGMLSTTEDQVISLFFGFGRIKYNFGRDCGNYAAVINLAKNFKKGLREIFQETLELDNVCAYVFPGSDHTHTTNTRFWDTFSTIDDLHGKREVKLNEWYRSVIDGTGTGSECSVEHGLF